MNRSTIYEFLKDETDLLLRFTHVGKGKYTIFIVPYAWNESYLLINGMRITDFQSIILFTNELVVRFWVNHDCQINIPYKDIEFIEVRENMNIGYKALHNGNRIDRG